MRVQDFQVVSTEESHLVFYQLSDSHQSEELSNSGMHPNWERVALAIYCSSSPFSLAYMDWTDEIVVGCTKVGKLTSSAQLCW
ncbi:hypothetical protein O6P43_029866 [Quillaja saponaria]|uniref:Uncharacterized protein n=1 Tax=Quillaja saponaria TaxID=32244 RepID=A0AAD7L2X3_QUISA|nr:hypothetical protein O6P43_029866 [Quillaja saponaria]